LDFSIAASSRGAGGKHNGGSGGGGGRAGLRSHGAFALSKVLQQSNHVAEVVLSKNQIGAYGASALFIACAGNPTVQKLLLRRCRIGERGALAFCDIVVASSECGLTEVDLSANFIGFKGIVAIESAMKKRSARMHLHDLAVNLEGNLVLQEVMNGVTHGLGVFLAFLGSYLLSERAQGMSHRHRVSCMVYSTSLIVLYISSTLYHSFFSMLNTRYIFAVVDKCAIYILIAGSYTPFLQIALWHEPLYSTYLLGFIWVCCFLGIYVEALMPTWKQKGRFSLAMYLGLGWSAIVCLPEVARVLPESAMNLMPFFVRNNNLDHAVWHLFVLGGSVFHWCGIYFHVAQL
jgi:hemolysin III